MKSPGLWIAVLLLATLYVFVMQPVTSDVLTGQVNVGNLAPQVTRVSLHDSDGGTIQLVAGSDTNIIYCDATVNDTNGYQDIKAAWAVIYNGTATNIGAANKNSVYYNYSCNLTGGSDTILYINCSFTVQHEAVNGTWTCNITVNDTSGNVNMSNATNTIDSQTGISVFELAINFGDISLGQNTTGSGTTLNQTTNITNQGNVMVDIKLNGSHYSCSQAGSIPVNYTKFNVSMGDYDHMDKRLPNDHTQYTESGFDLGVEGIATAQDAESFKFEYWTIEVPQSNVAGICTNQIQITGTYGGP